MTDLILTPDDVAEIVAIFDATAYSEIDIATRRFRLRVRREGDGPDAGWTQDWRFADAPAATEPTAEPAAGHPPVPEGLVAVPAPLPGTFYRSPSPGAPPFIEPGQAVTPETVVGIVETMKLMNPVHAGVDGRVAAILVANGAQVTAGAPLLHVAPE
ncbi:MAG TPA: biotin/lipoyl-containing protein [Novosphingobium sp.]